MEIERLEAIGNRAVSLARGGSQEPGLRTGRLSGSGEGAPLTPRDSRREEAALGKAALLGVYSCVCGPCGHLIHTAGCILTRRYERVIHAFCA